MIAKSILIIGGSGHVSGALSRAAVAAGHHVTILTRGRRPIPSGVTALTADRKDSVTVKEVLPENLVWDLVVDCIGYEVEDARQDVELFSGCAKQFAFISTDFVFDPPHRRFPQPFDNPHFLSDGSYGAEKRRCELEFINGHTQEMQWTIFRPCHVYGPPSELGCLPEALRDPQLLRKMEAGEPVRLVGGGHLLQQPILVTDLASLVLSVLDNPLSHRKIYCAAGPDIVASCEYYEIVARILGVPVQFEEMPMAEALRQHPEWSSFLCHRIYDLAPLRLDGLKVPNTPIAEGLAEHTEWLLRRH